MQKIRRQLTAEEYNALCKMTYIEREEWLFPDGVPVAWACGYGYYGHVIATDGKEFWAEFTLGSSCD